MKFIALILALLFVTPTYAQGPTRVVVTTQLLTGSAPTLITQGVELGGAGRGSIRVTVSAESTRTLSGAGTLRCYYWNRSLGRWVRNKHLDLDMTTVATAVRDATFPDLEIAGGYGRIHFMPDSVTVSAGTTVDVTIEVILL